MNIKRARKGPARLSEKLKRIREALNLSQSEMLKKIGAEEIITRTHIANYERAEREPTLPILLLYARTANVYVDVLIDDLLDLPSEIPCIERSAGIEYKV